MSACKRLLSGHSHSAGGVPGAQCCLEEGGSCQKRGVEVASLCASPGQAPGRRDQPPEGGPVGKACSQTDGDESAELLASQEPGSPYLQYSFLKSGSRGTGGCPPPLRHRQTASRTAQAFLGHGGGKGLLPVGSGWSLLSGQGGTQTRV